MVVVVTTLLKNMVGAGIFSLPIGLQHASPTVGLGLLAMIAVLSASSFFMIGYCIAVWKLRTLSQLWGRLVGRCAWVIDLMIFVNGWFCLVSYMVLIGDFTTRSFSAFLGPTHPFARSRALCLWSLTLTVLLPLSLAGDLRSLAVTSGLGLAVLAYVIAFVVQDSWFAGGLVGLVGEWRLGSFETIALFAQAFGAHYNAPKMFSELARPTLSRWALLSTISHTVAFFVYATFAWSGFRRFGSSVQGNVMRNYEPGVAVNIAWFGMAFSTSVSYPLVFNSMREAAVNLYRQILEAAGPGWSNAPCLRSIQRSRCADRDDAQRRTSGAVAFAQGIGTVILVLLNAVVSSFCEDVGIVNALTGCLTGCLICFVLPSYLFVRTLRVKLAAMDRTALQESLLPRTHAHSRHLLWLAALVGTVTGSAGVVFSVIGGIVIFGHHRAGP